MAQNNNFVSLDAQPTGQRVYYATPRFEMFVDTNALDLGDSLNDWIESIALPVTPDMLYTVLTTDFTSAQLSNNVIEYSALVRYIVWRPQ